MRHGPILALLAACLVAGATPPTQAGNWMPLLPDQDFYDFQLFAPPDLGEYNIYHEPQDGLFFTYDRLYWGITPPGVHRVAETDAGNYIFPVQPISPQTIVQLNNAGQDVIGGVFVFGSDVLALDLNSSWLRTKMGWGNRYEGGWIYDDCGVLLSYLDTGDDSQSFETINEFAASSPEQEFNQEAVGGGGLLDPTIPVIQTTITSTSPPPDHLISQQINYRNDTRIQGGGAAAIWRRTLGRRGSGTTGTFSLGPKFLQFEDRWTINYNSYQYAFNQLNDTTTGTGDITGGLTGNAAAGASDLSITGTESLTGTGQGDLLQTGDWETYTTNNMVGPEFGFLLQGSRGRWSYNAAFKFTPAFNWQNNLYRGANFPESAGADYIRATLQAANTSSSDPTDASPVDIAAPPLFLQLYAAGQKNATNSAEHRFIFSPIGEWRLGGEFRVSEAIRLRAGYTGMWMAGIARAVTNTGYRGDVKLTQFATQNNTEDPVELPDGRVIEPGEWYVERRPVLYNRIGAVNSPNEYVFTNGLDLGVEIRY